jgi:hypothetical protein
MAYPGSSCVGRTESEVREYDQGRYEISILEATIHSRRLRCTPNTFGQVLDGVLVKTADNVSVSACGFEEDDGPEAVLAEPRLYETMVPVELVAMAQPPQWHSSGR